mgnify:CR=1 FL=1
MQQIPAQQPKSVETRDASVSRLLSVRDRWQALWRYRWGMILVGGVALAGAFIRTMFLVTTVYSSTATLLPLKESSGGGLASIAAFNPAVESMLGGVGFSLGATDTRRLVSLLKSQTLLEHVVADLELIAHGVKEDLAASAEKTSEPSLDDVGRIGLELAAANPDIVLISSDTDPASGIVSMSDASLIEHIREVAPGVANLPVAALADIREAWHASVAAVL